ncbi:hypothetical protein HDU82_006080 [Entophlyctis luteolus]|nr:hypothetical protein HDU82_006080 [Entophlyctis luteolus]KAJ3388166.1 hypothetical protein HDU84_000246 [Entophlyctis sp. JEL0112]
MASPDDEEHQREGHGTSRILSLGGFAKVPDSEHTPTLEAETGTGSKQKDTESLFSAAAITAIVGSIASSVAIVMVNKFALNNGFPFASSLTALHQLTVFAFTLFLIKAKFVPSLPDSLPPSMKTKSRAYVAALYSSGLVLMNQSLAMNPVAFYQLLKMSCIPAIAFFQYILFKKVVNRSTTIALGAILLGVAISTLAPDTTQPAYSSDRHHHGRSFSNNGGNDSESFFAGLVTLIVSIGAVATTVLSQIEISMNSDLKRLSSFQIMHAMSLLSFLVCIAAAVFIDVKVHVVDILRPAVVVNKLAVFVDDVVSDAPVGWIFASCALSILVNMFGTNLIKYTSPMTFQVVGHLKTMLTLAIGAVLFGVGGLDGLKGVGVLVALVGMVLYSREKR